MKNLLFGVLAILLGGMSYAQDGKDFKIGAHGGFLIGDASDFYSFNAGVDVAYLFHLGDSFRLGGATGFSQYFSKKIKTATGEFKTVGTGIIPLALAVQYLVTDNIFLGGDIGYGIGTEKDTGGFYFQPKIGLMAGGFDLFASYKMIANDGTIGSIGVGFLYGL